MSETIAVEDLYIENHPAYYGLYKDLVSKGYVYVDKDLLNLVTEGNPLIHLFLKKPSSFMMLKDWEHETTYFVDLVDSMFL